MPTTSHSARARAALADLTLADPALGALALWCRHRDGAETATVGETITYGPDFAALQRHEQVGMAAHHVLHVALRHSARLAQARGRLGDSLDERRWSLSADALVNDAVLAAGFALPRPAVTASALLSQPREAVLARWDVDRLYHALAGAGGDGDGRGDAESQAAATDFVSDLRAQARTPGTEGRAEAAWRGHIARAMAAGRAAGRGLGARVGTLGDLPRPHVPWETVLRRLVSRALQPAQRPAPTRPARRWLARGARARRLGDARPGFEPGTRPFVTRPRVAIALDASGSIDDARLARFWSETMGLVARAGAEAHLLVFDEAIRHDAPLPPRSGPPPRLPRDGGTNFAPVAAVADRLRPAALVVLTDLELDPRPRPACPVIWAVPDAAGIVAPYGRLVDLAR